MKRTFQVYGCVVTSKDMVEPNDPNKTFKKVMFSIILAVCIGGLWTNSSELFWLYGNACRNLSNAACSIAIQVDYYSHPERYTPIFHERIAPYASVIGMWLVSTVT